MKKILVLFLMTVACLTITVPAHAGKGEMKYKMKYVIERHLFIKGQQVTLLNVNFEWPVFVAGTDVPALRQHIFQLFFNSENTSLRSALDAYTQTLGTEINSMPEGQGYQTEYIDLYLQLLGGVEGQFISFYSLEQKRKSDSAKAEVWKQTMFTYNIVKDKVLTARDILSSAVFPKGSEHWELVNYIVNNDIRIQSVKEVNDMPDQACLIPEGMVLNYPETAGGLGLDHMTLIPMNAAKLWMKTSVKNWVNDKKRVGTDYVTPMKPLTVPKEDDDSSAVYELVDEMPQYIGGEREMMEFIARTAKYPEIEQLLGSQGKVVVEFIVERDGSVSTPAVISSISPRLDREAVEAIMAMPPWTPGKNHGKPVRTRMVLPVNYKIK
ncbi:MAG: energy transducer TonB [Prevotella sp.]|nr:energy transducer TonB [Prevotella sp.]